MSNERIPSTIRLLIILEHIAKLGMPVTPTEVNRQLKLPKQTIHRLFATLESESFLHYSATTGTYSPGQRLIALASGTLSSLHVQTARTAVLRKIVEKIGETCNIALPSRDAMIYIDRMESKWALQIQLPIGTHVPLYCTASGKMYLSTLDKNQLKAYFSAVKLVAKTPKTITSERLLRAELKRICARGYASDNEEFLEGMIALALPIIDGNGRLLATLSFHGPCQRLSIEKAMQHLSTMRTATLELSKLIGHN